jgi:beta-mannosidase
MSREEISLNARWKLACFEDGEGIKAGAHLSRCTVGEWMDAVVPGDVHLDLMRAGKIADPFVGLNSLDQRWIEEKEWWYRREFVVPEKVRGRRMELQFGGLDTFATVWVNGKPAGKHQNMFVPCSFEVSRLLDCGHRNTVAVCLSSPLKAVKGKSTDGLVCAFEARERLHARKAQMSYGWDIAPRVVTTGIWRPAYLVARGDVSIGDVCIRTESLSDQSATISLDITLSRSSEIQIVIAGGHEIIKQSLKASHARMEFEIPNPRLWWPWNVGSPNLYHLTIKAFSKGEVQDEYSVRFGIRMVELVQKPQKDGGRSFVFAINGQQVYAKGANWIPGDAIFARMNRKKYRELIDLALANNVNMLRIWGGGIYEDPYFYRLCDEKGIMVWQDFMFTCARYPEDEKFLQEVHWEAEKVVTGLRNHPSVVLWCGDNEVDATIHWSRSDTSDQSDRSDSENRINRQVLPEVCARLDPTRPYLVSSPCSPFGDPDPQCPREGDYHNWNHGTSYKDDAYRKDFCRFVSEIGHLSIPWPESVERFIPSEHLWPPENKAWDFHFGTVEGCDPQRRAKVEEAIASFGSPRPDNLADYAYLSQVVQAIALKEWMEHYRRRKYLCGGSLYWNLYDNWPQFSDAVVDYYQNPKIAYYFVSRAFANLLVSLEDLGNGMVGVWLVNDELKDRSGKLLLRCRRLDGGTSWTRVLPVKLPANSSRMVWDMRLPRPLMDDPCGCFAQAQLLINGRVASESFYFPAEFKDIQWPQTQLTARLGSKGVIVVGSNLYARLVRIETRGRKSVFSDNFFDIPPGEERKVRIMTEPGSPVRISAANAQAVTL